MITRFTYRPPAASALALMCAATLSVVGCANDEGGNTPTGPRIEITSQSAALTAVENTEAALKGIVESGDFLAESTSLAETLNALFGTSTACDVSPAPCSAAEPDCVPVGTETCTGEDAVTEADLQEVRDNLKSAVDELVARLRDDVFIDANLDAAATNETQVTYRLGPKLLCNLDESSSETVDPSGDLLATPPATPEPDPDCVERVNKLNLRVRLTQPSDDDVDVTLIITDKDYEPITFQLYDDRLGVKLDLSQSLAVNEALGNDLESVDSLEGVVQLQLVKQAKLEYALRFSVLTDLIVSYHDDAGQDYSYSLAKSDPTIEFALNGNTKTVSATYNYGAIALLAPLKTLAQFFDDDPPQGLGGAVPEQPKTYTGVVELLVAGYTGTLSYTADTDKLSFKNMSYGNKAATLKHDGTLLASVDLNPDDGRSFDLVVEATPERDSASFSIDPTIDLNVTLNFAAVANQIDNIPEGLLNDKLRLWFTGNAPSFSVSNDGLRMVSGALHLSSERTPESNIDVAEGQCLVSASSTTDVNSPEGEPLEESSNLFDVAVTACE